MLLSSTLEVIIAPILYYPTNEDKAVEGGWSRRRTDKRRGAGRIRKE